MKKRIKLSEYPGWRGKTINFKFEDDEMNYSCGENDWKKYELMIELISQGADEKLLDELYDIGYDQGRDDEDMANAGAEL